MPRDWSASSFTRSSRLTPNLQWSLPLDDFGDPEFQRYKEELLASLRESLSFFSNEGKRTRERLTVRYLLNGLGIEHDDSELNDDLPEDGEVDVAFRGARFQAKESMDAGRKRMDEIHRQIAQVDAATTYEELLEGSDPVTLTFADIRRQTEDVARSLVAKYGPRERAKTDLVVYVNRHDAWEEGEAPAPDPDYSPLLDLGFRSVSVVSNRFCSVIAARDDAPQFLRALAGRVFERSVSW